LTLIRLIGLIENVFYYSVYSSIISTSSS